MTRDELCAAVRLARDIGRQGRRFGRLPLGVELPTAVGGAAGLYRRIARHPSADALVWIAMLRVHRAAADDALLAVEGPHGDPEYCRALLRFRLPDQRLVLRTAARAQGNEFARVARHVVRRAVWLARLNAAHAHRLLDAFAETCARPIRAAPARLWAPLLESEDAGVRERGFSLLAPG